MYLLQMIKDVGVLATCPNCGSSLTDVYCSACGQKKFDRKELTFVHFIKDSVEHITHFDGKIFQAIKLLFTKPGWLTREFSLGKFNSYIKPFTLFLLLNAFFFFLGHQLLSIKDADYTYYTQEYPGARKFFNEYISTHHTTVEEVSSRFNHTKELFQKLSYFILIPLFALGLQLLFIRRKKLHIEHLVHAIHTFCWYIITLVVLIPPLEWLFRLLHWRDSFELVTMLMLTFLCLVYNLISIKRIYSLRFFAALLYAIPATALMIFLDGYIYGMMNFFFTWLSFKLH